MYRSTYTPMLANDFASMMVADEWRIDLKDAWLVLWWCRQLGLTKSELERAVDVAGDSIADVKQYLASQQLSAQVLPARTPAF